jgi:hypothetical protein
MSSDLKVEHKFESFLKFQMRPFAKQRLKGRNAKISPANDGAELLAGKMILLEGKPGNQRQDPIYR